MGIKGLWKTVSDTGEHITLRSYSGVHKIEHGQKLRLGIDMGTLMSECAGATKAAEINGRFLNAPLHILFNKLAIYLKSPIVIVCVYDGPGRPKKKRGITVNTNPPSWTNPSQALVRSFGFHVHQAPGEAEAELAELNIRGIIDGMMTSDSDTLVFGARTIYRTIPQLSKDIEDEFILFDSTLIENDLGLTRGGLLLFALLAGGDYDDGINGCGRVTARRLASTTDLGDRLLETFQNNDNVPFQEQFLNRWRNSLKHELSSLVAERITRSFPDPIVLTQYIKPLTSWSEDPDRILDVTLWVSQEPSLVGLTQFSVQYLGCDTEEKVKTKFRSLVWEGAFLQMAYSHFALYDAPKQILRTPNTHARIMNACVKQRKGRFALDIAGGPLLQARLRVSADNLVELMSDKFSATEEDLFDVWANINLLPVGILAAPSTTSLKVHEPRHYDALLGELSSAPLVQYRSRVLQALDQIETDEAAPSESSTSAHRPHRRAATIHIVDPEVIDLTSD